MADEVVASIDDLMRDHRLALVDALRWSTVMLSEIERGGEEHFDGEKVKVHMMLAPHQGGGFGTETGILNSPQQMAHNVARLDTAIAHITVSFSTKAELAAKGDNSVINLLPDKMEMAEEGLRRNINEAMCGTGDALVCAVTGTNAASLTITVGTDANFYQLYAERIVDVLVRATGVVVGLSIKIVDFDEAAGTITTDTALSTDNTMGLYLPGSYGNAAQGIMQAVATTGNFQELSKTSVPAWRGVDASPASVQDPTMGIFDRAERLASQRSGKTPDFYICDPAVIDAYEQGITLQAQWSGAAGQLETGWEGVKYRNKVLVRENDMPARTAVGITKDDIKIYSREEGPDWDTRDGGMFKRFARALPFEAWLVWHYQMGFRRCITQVKVGNLGRAQ